MDDIVQLIYLQPVSDTITNRFHNLQAHGTSVFERFLKWDGRLGLDGTKIVMSHSERELDTVTPACHRYGWKCVQRAPMSELDALALLLSETSAETIEYLVFGAMILPDSCRIRMRQHHAIHGNGYTAASNVPLYCSPCLASAPLIRFLQGIQPASGQTLRSLTARLARNCPSQAGLLAYSPSLCMVPFDFAAEYNIDIALVPAVFRTEGPLERRISLAHIARSNSSIPDHAVGTRLQSYKDDMVTAIASQYFAIRRNYRTVHPRPLGTTPSAVRVLYVANRCMYSGAEESFVRMIQGLNQEYVLPSAVVACDGLLAERLRQTGANVAVTERDFSKGDVLSVGYFDELLNRVAPDIVHLNGACGMPILLSATRRNVAVVQHLRSPDLASLGEALYAADAIVSVSHFLANHVRREDIDSAKLHVIYDGIDTTYFRPGAISKLEARRLHDIPEDAQVILTVARLTPDKRVDLLLSAFDRIADRFPKSQLLIVGEPQGDHEYEARIFAQLERMSNAPRVRFLGFQPEIRSVASAADIQVLCSENESLGTCILESMGLGVPVIVSDGGGLREIVRHGVSGFIVPIGDDLALAGRLELLLADSGLRTQMGQSSRDLIEAEFSINHCAAQVLALYRLLLGR